MAEEYRVGGTCVIRGCVPKKLLVYGAHFAEDLRTPNASAGTCPTVHVRLEDAHSQRVRGSRPDQQGLHPCREPGVEIVNRACRDDGPTSYASLAGERSPQNTS